MAVKNAFYSAMRRARRAAKARGEKKLHDSDLIEAARLQALQSAAMQRLRGRRPRRPVARDRDGDGDSPSGDSCESRGETSLAEQRQATYIAGSLSSFMQAAQQRHEEMEQEQRNMQQHQQQAQQQQQQQQRQYAFEHGGMHGQEMAEMVWNGQMGMGPFASRGDGDGGGGAPPSSMSMGGYLPVAHYHADAGASHDPSHEGLLDLHSSAFRKVSDFPRVDGTDKSAEYNQYMHFPFQVLSWPPGSGVPASGQEAVVESMFPFASVPQHPTYHDSRYSTPSASQGFLTTSLQPMASYHDEDTSDDQSLLRERRRHAEDPSRHHRGTERGPHADPQDSLGHYMRHPPEVPLQASAPLVASGQSARPLNTSMASSPPMTSTLLATTHAGQSSTTDGSRSFESPTHAIHPAFRPSELDSEEKDLPRRQNVHCLEPGELSGDVSTSLLSPTNMLARLSGGSHINGTESGSRSHRSEFERDQCRPGDSLLSQDVMRPSSRGDEDSHGSDDPDWSELDLGIGSAPDVLAPRDVSEGIMSPVEVFGSYPVDDFSPGDHF